jgi:hypothetical protein
MSGRRLFRHQPGLTFHLYTGSFWLRNVMMFAGVISLAGAVWALVGFPGG